MKKTKKTKAGKKTLLGGAAKSIKKLSTTQKVVGGTLLAVGLGFLAKRSGKLDGLMNGLSADASAAEENLTALDEESGA